MDKKCTPKEIKNRLSNIGEPIGDIVLEYITELEEAYNETEELLDKQIEATYELFKENAELKEKNKAIELYADLTSCKNNDAKLMLREAKEIIKGLLELGSIGDGDYNYVAEAERFLEEVKQC